MLSARNMGGKVGSNSFPVRNDGSVLPSAEDSGHIENAADAGNLRIYCINDAQSFICDELDMESSSVKIALSTLEEMQYLYEPNASLMKAGCFSVLSERYGARMLSKNSHLFVSRKPIAVFPGRSFRIIAVSSFNKKELKRHLSGITKANIATRNFPPFRSRIAQAIEAEGWWRNLYLRYHTERRKPCVGDNGESVENLENV